MDRRFSRGTDQWPHDKPVVRINWPRVVGFAGFVTVTAAILLILGLQTTGERTRPPSSSDPTTLQLVVKAASPGSDSRSPLVPLRILVRGPSELASAATVDVIGLPSRWTLSAGQRLGDRWRIPTAQLSGAVVLPPQDFAGVIDLLAELQLADGTLVERRSVRLTVITPDPDIENTMNLLVSRAEGLIADHEISGARLYLQRAARLGSAHAALLLGETYEGCSFNPHYPLHCDADAERATARTWFEKAAELGSADARQRLDRIASHKAGGDLRNTPGNSDAHPQQYSDTTRWVSPARSPVSAIPTTPLSHSRSFACDERAGPEARSLPEPSITHPPRGDHAGRRGSDRVRSRRGIERSHLALS